MTLKDRRQRGDLTETYKILTGKERVDATNFFEYATTSLRGHPLKVCKKRSRLQLRQNFFSQRVVDAWNNLPRSVVCAETVNSFKSRLDHHLAIQYGQTTRLGLF